MTVRLVEKGHFLQENALLDPVRSAPNGRLKCQFYPIFIVFLAPSRLTGA